MHFWKIHLLWMLQQGLSVGFTSLTPWAMLKQGSVPLISSIHIPQSHYKTQSEHIQRTDDGPQGECECCSVGPITRPSGRDYLSLPENVTTILMHILHHHHAMEEGWLRTHLGLLYFSIFSGKAPAVSAVIQQSRHGCSVRLQGWILRAWLVWLATSMRLGFLLEFNRPRVSYYNFFSNRHSPRCLCYRILL